MRKGALALVSVLAVASSGACGRPRERDCRVLLPRLEEADESTVLAGNARGDATRVYAMQAARSGAAARWLESAAVETDDIKRGLPPLVEALGRHADAAQRGDGALRALGFHMVDGGAETWPALSKLFALESKAQSPYLADAMTLSDRCGFFLADAKADHPECVALSAVLAHFLEPVPGVKSPRHIAECLAELAAVHSPDPRVESALRSVESILREVGAALLATTADGPASEMIAQLRHLAKALTDERSAAQEVARSSAVVRAMCHTP